MTHLEIFEKLVDLRMAHFIKGNVPSSKNSKEIIQIYTGRSTCCNAPYNKIQTGTFVCTKCGQFTNPGKRPVITDSKLTKEYKEKTMVDYITCKSIFENFTQFPIAVGMYFVRDSKRNFDFNNISQVVCDMLTQSHCIEDDNINVIIPVYLGSCVDKENAGVYIYPFKYHSEKFFKRIENVFESSKRE